MHQTKQRTATLSIIAAAVLWGTIGPFSIWAGRDGLQPTQIAFWRALLACIPFTILAARGRLRIPARDYAGMAVFGATGIAVMYAAFFVAVAQVGVGVAAVLLYTGPAWVAVVESAIHRRLPNLPTVFALLLTVAGVVLLSLHPGSHADTNTGGIVIGVMAGIAFSTHFTFAPRYIERHGAVIVYAVALAAAALLLFAVSSPALPTRAALLPLFYLSLIATFAASLLFARGIVDVAPIRAAITATVEPVVAMVLSIVVLGTSLRAAQMIGAALILAGVTLILRVRARSDL